MTVPFTIIHDKDVGFVVVCPNLTFRYNTLKVSRKRGQRTDEKLGEYTVSVSVTVAVALVTVAPLLHASVVSSRSVDLRHKMVNLALVFGGVVEVEHKPVMLVTRVVKSHTVSNIGYNCDNYRLAWEI